VPTIGAATKEIMIMGFDPQSFCASTSEPDSPQGVFPWLSTIPPRRPLIALCLLDPDLHTAHLTPEQQLELFPAGRPSA
jgi:hypothetical protein